MSNYRRLISYIYAYEGGIKGKNIGFAKIEVRNGQCRIHVNVKKIFLGSSDIGVYLLSPNREILLGRIFIRNGAGEFRVNVSAGNVEGSGCTMEQCYGLTIHETENTWRTYTTIWEDAVTKAAEVELADVTSDKVGTQARQELRPSVSEEIKRELEQEDARRDEVTPWKETEQEPGAAWKEKGPDNTQYQMSTGMAFRESAEDGFVPAQEERQEGRLGEDAEEQVGGSAGERTEGRAEGQIDKSGAGQTEGSPGEQAGENTGGTGQQIEEEVKEQAKEGAADPAEGAAGEQIEEKIKGQTGEGTGEPISGSTGTTEGSAGEQARDGTGDTEDQIRGSTEEKSAGDTEESIEGTGPQVGETWRQAGQSQTGMAMAERLLASRRPADGKSPGERLLEQLMIERPQTNPSGEENAGQNRERVQERMLKFAKVLMQGKSPGTENTSHQGTLLEAVRTGPRPISVIETTPRSLPEPGDPARLKELDRQEREEAIQGTIWSRLQRRYPKVLAFDYVHDSEILTIKPQDIGILPRENWVYGNNSFLLHGYYNYRHLILARLEIPGGEPRYLLGVPGHYFSNEKNLASMFGFPNFVLAKKQPEEDGRFGYWYTDLRL